MRRGESGDFETNIDEKADYFFSPCPTTSSLLFVSIFPDWNTVDGCNDDSYVYSCPNAKDLVLSYDDGPSNFTDALLDELDKAGAKGVLCMVGQYHPMTWKENFGDVWQFLERTTS